MSDMSQGPGWWQASDGKWYPPEQAPGAQPPAGAPPAYGAAPSYGAPVVGPGAIAGGAPPAGGAPLAEWAQRVVAFIIDYGIALVGWIAVWLVAMILGAISDALGALVFFVGWVAMVGYSFYIAYLNGAKGQSPGKALTGLKVVSEADGSLIGGGMGIVRSIAHILDSLACYIGYLWPLWDVKKQTFADKVMKTVVLANQEKQSFGPDIFKA